MIGWTRSLCDADWEPVPEIPSGMRMPAHGEVEEIVRIARSRCRRSKIMTKDIPVMSPFADAVNRQHHMRDIAAISMRIMRERGIFVEGA